jgi:hypothetical protein
MKRPQIGDIIEIPTAVGLAYAQYTHQHDKPPKMGALIRVFDRIFDRRPTDWSDIAASPVRFSTFTPLSVAVHRGTFKVVGHHEVADENKVFPLFRNGNPHLQTKKVAVWWLWDGEKEWMVGKITDEQRKLPLLAIMNDGFLIMRIEQGWTPETDPE